VQVNATPGPAAAAAAAAAALGTFSICSCHCSAAAGVGGIVGVEDQPLEQQCLHAGEASAAMLPCYLLLLLGCLDKLEQSLRQLFMVALIQQL
jgi:hypothetical protein